MYALTMDNKLVEINNGSELNGEDVLAIITTRSSHPCAKNTQEILHYFSKEPKRQTSPEQILESLQHALSTP